MIRHKNIGKNYACTENEGKYSILRYAIAVVLFFAIVGCGSKKKTLEITKEERQEQKDYYLKQFDSLKQEIEYRNAIIQLSIEPVDPKLPNKAKFTRTETGFEYEGENSKMGAKSENQEKEVRTESGGKKEESDKGKVKETKKGKNVDLEKEGEAVQWKWSIWGIAVIVIGILFIVFFGRIKNGYKRFVEWF